jgi:uncharacterized SAM-dependent methyltransferase
MTETEKRIILELLECAVQASYSFKILNGTSRNTSVEDIINEMAATGIDTVIFYDKNNKKVGWVLLVYNGNCDWSDNEAINTSALDVANNLC